MGSTNGTASTTHEGPVEIQQHPCAYCQSPATQVCSGCSGAPGNGEHGNTYYCSADCQKAARPKHKKLCLKLQQRRALYRAGDVAQRMFYTFRETVFDNQVIKTVDEGEKLIVHLSHDWPSGVDPSHIIYCPYPPAGIVPESEKAAVLCYSACNDATGCMHGTYQRLLAGIASNIEEYLVCVHKYRKRTVGKAPGYIPHMIMGETGQDYVVHSLLKVTLKSGEEYAMDLSSAQFGYDHSVDPWESYCVDRGYEIEAVYGFGYHAALFQDHGGLRPSQVNNKLVHSMDDEMTEWEKSHIHLSDLLKQSQATFSTSSEALHQHVLNRLQSEFEAMHAPGAPLHKFEDFSVVRDPHSSFWADRSGTHWEGTKEKYFLRRGVDCKDGYTLPFSAADQEAGLRALVARMRARDAVH